MQGKWVYGVIFSSKYGTGFNSVYSDYNMAIRKMKRMEQDVKNAGSKQRVLLQKIMYFKGVAEEKSFADYCSVCGDQLKSGEKLTKV